MNFIKKTILKIFTSEETKDNKTNISNNYQTQISEQISEPDVKPIFTVDAIPVKPIYVSQPINSFDNTKPIYMAQPITPNQNTTNHISIFQPNKNNYRKTYSHIEILYDNANNNFRKNYYSKKKLFKSECGGYVFFYFDSDKYDHHQIFKSISKLYFEIFLIDFELLEADVIYNNNIYLIYVESLDIEICVQYNILQNNNNKSYIKVKKNTYEEPALFYFRSLEIMY
jgi:hypothetical protein